MSCPLHGRSNTKRFRSCPVKGLAYNIPMLPIWCLYALTSHGYPRHVWKQIRPSCESARIAWEHRQGCFLHEANRLAQERPVVCYCIKVAA
jgi:hypothetical protein